MNRITYPIALIAACLFAAVFVQGCKPSTVDYQIQQFTSLRVLNFASDCSGPQDVSPMDFYWFSDGQTRPTLANVHNLSFGEASVYSNLLPIQVDSIVVTPAGIAQSADVRSTIDLASPTSTNTGRYSFIVTQGSTPGTFAHMFIPDGVVNPASNMTYVRFINLQPNTGVLTVRVNDPLYGETIDTSSFGSVGQYVALTVANDTSYAFFVTNQQGQVIARLAYQTFTGGNCYTLVYAGDECETLATGNLADTTTSSIDTLRLRAFDDNSLGNDQTSPVIPAFRYNIVNGIIPTTHPYDAAGDPDIGFIVNGEGLQQYYGFSLPPIPAYMGGGENTAVLDNGAYDVNFQSAEIPKPLVIQGIATNATGTSQNSLFNAGLGSTTLNEGILIPTPDTAPNHSFSILFYDTVPASQSYLDTAFSLNTHFNIIPIPDIPNPNAAILVFANAITATPGQTTTKLNALFWANNNGTVTAAPKNTAQGLTNSSSGTSDILNIPITAGNTAQLSILDSIGSTEATRVAGYAGAAPSFTAQAGGIYEIVAVGPKTSPQILIMHVNP